MRVNPRILVVSVVLVLAAAVAAVFAIRFVHEGPAAPGVHAGGETQPVDSSGDAADDPAIWLHPEDPSLSLILGTDKKAGLAVYDLSGARLQFLPGDGFNNVDVRSGVVLDGRPVELVAASDPDRHTVAFFAIDIDTRRVAPMAGTPLALDIEGSGLCMYESARTGSAYVFVVGMARDHRDYRIEQWELRGDGAGGVHGTRVRTIRAGPRSEGCVADDQNALLYVSIEREGILRYPAEPDGGLSGECIVRNGFFDAIDGDIEGLAIARDAGGGYLLASNQGNDEFLVFDRVPPNRMVGRFRVTATPAHDGVTHTDGIDVVTTSLGPLFPNGLFVAQDDEDEGGHQNFKLVPWDSVTKALALRE